MIDPRLPDLPQDKASQDIAKSIRKHLFEISCMPELENFKDTLQLPTTIRELFTKAIKTYEIYLRHKLNQLKKLGREPTCKSGCAFCCQFMPVGISALEVIFLYDVMHEQKTFSIIFRRFLERQEILDEISSSYTEGSVAENESKNSLSEAILLEYRKRRIPCPLLNEKKTCSLYFARPFVCRGYFSCSPRAWCDPSHPHHAQALRIAIPLPDECQHILDKIDNMLALDLPETLSGALLVFSTNIARFHTLKWI